MSVDTAPDQETWGPERLVDVAAVLRREAATADASGLLRESSVRALADAGLLLAVVPAQSGGLELDVVELCAAGEVIGGACLSTAYLWAMHCQQLDTVWRYGGAEVRRAALDLCGQGRLLCSITTESPSRCGDSSFPGLTTVSATLQRRPDGYLVERSGPVVSAAAHAGAFLVTMCEGDGSRPDQVSLVFVPAADAKVTMDPPHDLVGMRGTETGAVTLHAVVAPWAIVGPPGEFRAVLADSFGPLGHVLWAATWVGAARQAVRSAVPGLAHSFRLLPEEECAQRCAQLGRIRLLLEGAAVRTLTEARRLSARRRAGRPASPGDHVRSDLLKVAVAEDVFSCVDQLLDLVGMAGFVRGVDHELERLWRDLRAARLTTRNTPLLVAAGRLSLIDRAIDLGWEDDQVLDLVGDADA